MTGPLTNDFIAGLLKKEKKAAATKTATGKRKRKDHTEPREIDTWWKLDQKLGICDNPECPDQRPMKVAEGNAMVAEVHGKYTCRFCFLAGFSKEDATE